ncbi:MAG: ABC transporter permease subunit [Thermoprotei archaeon]
MASAAGSVLIAFPVVFVVFLGLGIYRSALGFGLTVFDSIGLSLVSASVACLVDVALFTPLAYELSRKRNKIMESFTDIPASIPHPIVGIALLALDSPVTPVGRFLLSLGINFFDTFLGLVTALTIVSAPIYIRSIQSHLSAKTVEPEWFASGMGASRLRILMSVVLPSSLKELVSSALTSMSRALSEFGSIAIVAYYVLQAPFKGVEPASVLVYQYYGYYGPQVAFTAAATMILLSLPVMLVARLLG